MWRGIAYSSIRINAMPDPCASLSKVFGPNAFCYVTISSPASEILTKYTQSMDFFLIFIFLLSVAVCERVCVFSWIPIKLIKICDSYRNRSKLSLLLYFQWINFNHVVNNFKYYISFNISPPSLTLSDCFDSHILLLFPKDFNFFYSYPPTHAVLYTSR